MLTKTLFSRSMVQAACILIALFLTACSSSSKPNTGNCRAPAAGYYCVQAGDNLYRLGLRFGSSVAQLKAWNNLTNNQIRVGQLLRVRANASPNNSQVASQARLRMPVAGQIVQTYTPKNKGIDIAAPFGTTVQAAGDGMVMYAGEGVRGYGKLLLIKHSESLITAYAHNHSFLVETNARVKAGQAIATVGNTGRADGQNILHFEVRVNGQAVNPKTYLE